MGDHDKLMEGFVDPANTSIRTKFGSKDTNIEPTSSEPGEIDKCLQLIAQHPDYFGYTVYKCVYLSMY